MKGSVFQPPWLSPSGQEDGEVGIEQVAEAYQLGIRHVEVFGDVGMSWGSISIFIVVVELFQVLEQGVIGFVGVDEAVDMIL